MLNAMCAMFQAAATRRCLPMRCRGAVNTTACKRSFSRFLVVFLHTDGAVLQVNTTACKRLFSLGCVAHTDGAVLQAALLLPHVER